MDWPLLIMVAFAAFFGGILVVSRVIAWVTGLVLVTRSSATERPGLALAQFFLHSGPWALAVAIAALYYVASLSQRTWLWAVLGGFGLAVAVLVMGVVTAHLRQRRGSIAPVPLTPEHLLKIRRRFFWVTTIYFGGATSALMLYFMWPQFGQGIGLAAWIVIVCIGGGYVFSWFMWQWVGASLQAREDARRRAERSNAV
jgi:hypothetical protein